MFHVAAAAQEHEHGAAPGGRFGTVSFATSCVPAVQPDFNRAVAMLHSFEFPGAIAAFEAVAQADKSCGIAYWGIALSRWGNPFAAGIKPVAQLQKGREALARQVSIGASTPRERAYVDAVSKLYVNFDTTDQRTRVLAYRDAMASLASTYPEDTEATIFYALALAEAAPPTDKTYADLLKAGAMLEKLFASQPDHPGLAHYIIHSYDVPPLAPRALEAARQYVTIAPSSPHALHMPSHTFTRVGLWQESIETNIAAGAAARRDGATAEELHTLDYRMYAYLQTGQDAEARRLIDALPEIAARFDPDAIGSAAPGSVGVFALAASPARYAVERRAWDEAKRLEPRVSRFPHTEAMTYFARALGSARTGDPAGAKSAVDAVQRLQQQLVQANEPYWAEQVEIERRGAAAWVTLAEGRTTEALTEMRAAADREDATEKNAATPGPIAPARELLGEMLLQAHQPEAALAAFEATLMKDPRRFHALSGAAEAAAQAGNIDASKKYSAQLLDVCVKADTPGRPELVAARKRVMKN